MAQLGRLYCSSQLWAHFWWPSGIFGKVSLEVVCEYYMYRMDRHKNVYMLMCKYVCMYVTWKHTWMYEYIKWKKSIEKDAKQLKLLHSSGMSISYYSHIEKQFHICPNNYTTKYFPNQVHSNHLTS